MSLLSGLLNSAAFLQFLFFAAFPPQWCQGPVGGLRSCNKKSSPQHFQTDPFPPWLSSGKVDELGADGQLASMALLLTIGVAVVEWWHFGLEVLNSCNAGTNLLYWCQGRGHNPRGSWWPFGH